MLHILLWKVRKANICPDTRLKQKWNNFRLEIIIFFLGSYGLVYILSVVTSIIIVYSMNPLKYDWSINVIPE